MTPLHDNGFMWATSHSSSLEPSSENFPGPGCGLSLHECEGHPKGALRNSTPAGRWALWLIITFKAPFTRKMNPSDTIQNTPNYFPQGPVYGYPIVEVSSKDSGVNISGARKKAHMD
ncbi:hypothetical protein FOPE_05243 [Fonsecaea pedrosoi]|nr:hypothetical protein FOPE_05243 [Fonsecaea pedrosoi]